MKPKLDAMTLTTADVRALRLLAAFKSLVRPGHFGDSLWPGRYRGSACSCPFARPAGKVLNRLKTAGVAHYVYRSRREYGWEITRQGRALILR
jgi:hypothetical protein